MNARQKAKHFKKLYERTLPGFCIGTMRMIPESLVHYKVSRRVGKPEIFEHPEAMLLKNEIIHALLTNMKPVIEPFIVVEDDPMTNSLICSLDFWLKKPEEVDHDPIHENDNG